MKKILLTLTLSLLCIFTQAQKVDKKLIIGKWQLYSMSFMGRTWTRDSIEEKMRSLATRANTGSDADEAEQKDSTEGNPKGLNKNAINDFIRTTLETMFQTYLTFDSKGNTTMLGEFAKDGNGGSGEATGTYQWSGENRFIQTLGKTKPEVFIVVKLTPDKLTLKSGEKDMDQGQMMTFSRVK